jgi:hypothetical protein
MLPADKLWSHAPWPQAVHRYCKFLHLADVKKDLMVVPMYDIDLIWHTHISMHPSAYPEQCRSAIGWVSGYLSAAAHPLLATWPACLQLCEHSSNTHAAGHSWQPVFIRTCVWHVAANPPSFMSTYSANHHIVAVRALIPWRICPTKCTGTNTRSLLQHHYMQLKHSPRNDCFYIAMETVCATWHEVAPPVWHL